MASFKDAMRARLPEGMTLPEEFAALFDRIESRGLLACERVPDKPPRDAPEYGSLVANPCYQDWVRSTYDTTSPATASESVGAPPDFNTTESDVPFWTWVRGQQG